MTDLDRLRTHARTIVEGEGAEIEDTALVEAVAADMRRAACEGTSCWLSPGRAQILARAALSTIRKHQAGE